MGDPYGSDESMIFRLNKLIIEDDKGKLKFEKFEIV